jgi:hypothetical protein
MACRYLSTPADSFARTLITQCAAEALKKPLPSSKEMGHFPELDHVPAKFLFRLHSYRTECANAAKVLLGDKVNPGSSWLATMTVGWLKCQCSPIVHSVEAVEYFDVATYNNVLEYKVEIPKWFREYLLAVVHKMEDEGKSGNVEADVLLEETFWKEKVIGCAGKCTCMEKEDFMEHLTCFHLQLVKTLRKEIEKVRLFTIACSRLLLLIYGRH